MMTAGLCCCVLGPVASGTGQTMGIIMSTIPDASFGSHQVPVKFVGSHCDQSPGVAGKYMVPVLWDKTTETIGTVIDNDC